MSDAIAKVYGEAFTPEELADLRRQIQMGETSFICCVEMESDDATDTRP